MWHFLKDLLFPICFDAQVVPFGKITSNHRVECHESADDTQLYHLPLRSEFFPCPAVILDGDLQMGKSELPCPQPWENRMLTKLLIRDSTLLCVPMDEGSLWRCSQIKGLGIISESFTSLQRLLSGC